MDMAVTAGSTAGAWRTLLQEGERREPDPGRLPGRAGARGRGSGAPGRGSGQGVGRQAVAVWGPSVAHVSAERPRAWSLPGSQGLRGCCVCAWGSSGA